MFANNFQIDSVNPEVLSAATLAVCAGGSGAAAPVLNQKANEIVKWIMNKLFGFGSVWFQEIFGKFRKRSCKSPQFSIFEVNYVAKFRLNFIKIQREDVKVCSKMFSAIHFWNSKPIDEICYRCEVWVVQKFVTKTRTRVCKSCRSRQELSYFRFSSKI